MLEEQPVQDQNPGQVERWGRSQASLLGHAAQKLLHLTQNLFKIW